jgi:predicted DNA-binding WGR domain protein
MAIDSIFALDLGRDLDQHSAMSDLAPNQKIQLLVLDRIDRTRNMARYYVLSIEPTLFEEISLVREWGRIGKRGGRRIELHADHTAARMALGVWLAHKIKRGYVTRSAKRRS